MGLSQDNEKLCPVCGGPISGLFPTMVDGVPICGECKEKINLPVGTLEEMSLEDLRKYMNFYRRNQPLQDMFEETLCWEDCIRLDVPKRLFCLGSGVKPLVLEASCLKAFRIMEDKKCLFASCSLGLKCFESDSPARIEVMAPLVELTLEHPYWGGTRRLAGSALQFDDGCADINDFRHEYQKKTEELHTLASGLMYLINPNAPEIPVFSGSFAVSGGLRVFPNYGFFGGNSQMCSH